MGRAQCLWGAKGKEMWREKTTQLWPKEKKGLARVERSGSWCMSAPQMRRPDLRAKVSSTAATRTGEQNGNSKGNTQCPSSSRFQRALLKKRWKEQ